VVVRGGWVKEEAERGTSRRQEHLVAGLAVRGWEGVGQAAKGWEEEALAVLVRGGWVKEAAERVAARQQVWLVAVRLWEAGALAAAGVWVGASWGG
jgi:hypothetical protein